MKNIMRRTVAFMLMACLLLSVMPQVAMAVTVDKAYGTYEFKFELAEGKNAGYECSIGTTMGDLEIIDKAGRMKAQTTYYQVMNFSTAQTGFFALGITGVNKGTYDLQIDIGHAYVLDIYVMPLAAYNSNYLSKRDASGDTTLTPASAEYVGTITGSATSGETLSGVTFATSGDYVVVVDQNENCPTNLAHMAIYSIVLTNREPATVGLKQGVYTYTTKYNGIHTDTQGRNYVSPVGQHMDSFFFYAQSGTMLQYYDNEGAGMSSIQANGNAYFTTGKWYALKFNVAQSGKYDITLHSSYHKDANVFVVPVSYVDSNNNKLVSASGNTNNQAYVDGLTPDMTTTGTATKASTNTFTKVLDAGNYYLIFESASDGTGLFRFEGMTLTPYTVKGLTTDTMYAKVNAAIAAGEKSVQLTTDITEDVVITDDATLDLNGKTVYGQATVVNGQIVDNAGNGSVTGKVTATGNEWLALYDGSAYKFFNYTTKAGILAADKSESGFEEHWFDIVLSEEAYQLIAAGESGIDVAITVSWTDESGAGSKTLAYNENGIADWVTNELDGKDYALCVQITNIPDDVTDVAVDAVFTANGAVAGFNS